MAKYLLGLDNGSTVIKAGLYDADTGNEVGSAGEKCDYKPGKPGIFERDMNEIFAANVKAIRALLDKTGVAGGEILAVATSGHGNGAHLVDSAGEPVGNSIEGADSRAAGLVSRFMADGTFDKAHPLNTQALWPALSCLLLSWLAANEPERLKRSRWFMNVGDYVRFRLTGEPGAEITTMSGTGLINHRIGKYDQALLDILGIGEMYGKLPPLLPSAAIGGKVTAEAAGLTGLVAGTPVAAGLYDIDAASLATGLLEEGAVTAVAGSWANNLFITRELVENKDLFSAMFYANPGYWLMLEGSPTGTANLEWLVERFLAAETAEAHAKGESPYAVCDAAMRATAPGDADIIFLPFLYGANAVPNARAAFFGLDGMHRREHVIRAICEGVCFSHRWHIDRIRTFSKVPIGAVRLAGGGAKSPEWVQMYADVLGVPIEVTTAKELGTMGAAMCAGVATGVFADFVAAAARMVRMRDPVRPEEGAVGAYTEKYERYLRAIDAVRVYGGK